MTLLRHFVTWKKNLLRYRKVETRMDSPEYGNSGWLLSKRSNERAALSLIKISVHCLLKLESLLVACLFWSSLSSFAELFKDHWSVQVYNKCICIFSTREHHFLPDWSLVRILSYHNGPPDIYWTTHFHLPYWCTEGNIPGQKIFLEAQCHPFSQGAFVTPISSWASVSSQPRGAR